MLPFRPPRERRKIMSTLVSTYFPASSGPLTVYGKAFVRLMGWSLVVAMIAGFLGLAPQFDALLSAPGFSSLVMIAGGMYMLWNLWISERCGPRGICEDIQIVLCVGVLPPIFGGASAFAWVFLTAMHGAGALL